MNERVFSAPTYVRNLPWKIEVQPYINMISQDTTKKKLDFFIYCQNGTLSCKATAELKLLSQNGGTPISTKITHIFSPKEPIYRFPDFLCWSDILNPENGWIKDDFIIIEVTLSANDPSKI